ncbi:Ctr copper transporter family-domain-containing protein [Spinellus fusiger]|nr:Ctr copper transporter family-domain-containing protein [Spinellus fusiger]KAI7862186.1 Ctr copper transporter family-domain-containing protein [Spinellus fusiger]
MQNTQNTLHTTMDHHHEMPSTCQMNMIFNWQIQDVCVVFEWWHIHSVMQMILSCIAITIIAVAYEYLRAQSVVLDKCYKKALENDHEEQTREYNSLLGRDRPFPRSNAVMRSLLYACLTAISFWLMLVFMTFNGYLMLTIVIGAGVGHFLFGTPWLTSDRSIQCH